MDWDVVVTILDWDEVSGDCVVVDCACVLGF